MAYTARFEDALAFTAQLHRDQTRKGVRTPYITHLIGVAAIVGDHGGSEDQVIGALLHDALEDQGYDGLADEIAARYGHAVLQIVRACTDAEAAPGQAKPPWQARKRAYIDHVLALDADDPALLVSAADKLYNARSLWRDWQLLGDALWSRFTATQAQTLWYYRALADAYTSRSLGDPLKDAVATALAEVVSQLESTAK